MKTTLLNPFSLRLKKSPFMEVGTEPIFKNSDFRIYRYCDKWFIHTFKNIVIAERCAPNKTIFTNLKGETKPTEESAIYHEFERPQAAMMEGIEAAKKMKFNIQ